MGHFPPDKTKASQGVQEREQVRFRLPRSNPCRGDSGTLPERLECFAFHLEVCRDVTTGRGNARVSQVIADDGDVVAGLQQGDGTAVAKHMGGDVPPTERWNIVRRQRHVLAQDIGDTIARERFPTAAEENRIAWTALLHGWQTLQSGGRFRPERTDSISSALAVEADLVRSRSWPWTASASLTRAPVL